MNKCLKLGSVSVALNVAFWVERDRGRRGPLAACCRAVAAQFLQSCHPSVNRSPDREGSIARHTIPNIFSPSMISPAVP